MNCGNCPHRPYVRPDLPNLKKYRCLAPLNQMCDEHIERMIALTLEKGDIVSRYSFRDIVGEISRRAKEGNKKMILLAVSIKMTGVNGII